MRPLIAIPGRRSPRVEVLRFSGTITAEAICEAVWAAGGEPLTFHGPDADPAAEVRARLARFDGLLLPGGGDLDPARFGQPRRPASEPPMPHDDDLDLAAVHAALDLAIPTLAICRGMQVVNVALGGDLIQDLPHSLVPHRNARHGVETVGRLREIVGKDRIEVSSYHHQAVDRIGNGLSVIGRADDGCVEALEHRDGTLLAVQWHPEDLHATSPADAALFADLVERAARYATVGAGR